MALWEPSGQLRWALGQYHAAVRILSFLLLVSAYATQAALPWLARRSRDGDLKRATTRLTGPLVLIGLAGLLLIWPFSEELLQAIFGAGFEAAATSLRCTAASARPVLAVRTCNGRTAENDSKVSAASWAASNRSAIPVMRATTGIATAEKDAA